MGVMCESQIIADKISDFLCNYNACEVIQGNKLVFSETGFLRNFYFKKLTIQKTNNL